jgi:hypothetical protein
MRGLADLPKCKGSVVCGETLAEGNARSLSNLGYQSWDGAQS